MRGLTVLVTRADGDNFSAALALACSNAALGGQTRLYCHGSAVTLLLPSPALTQAVEMDVKIVACQSGLAMHDMPIPDFAEAGGMISLLADLGEDRLVTF